MDIKTCLKFVVFASIVTSSLATCVMENMALSADRCNYNVICSETFGSVQNPRCDSSHIVPYVIFYIAQFKTYKVNPQFFGATNFDARVREIVANGNNWNCIDSYAFKYYLNSIRLDISKNNIKDIKNYAFQSLNYLVNLNISNNNIDMLYPKTFVMTDSGIESSLRELDISNNKLRILSSELSELTGLQRLYLQNNLLETIADEAFMRLKSLEYLNLSNNSLTFLNITLTNLMKLRTLDISYNNLVKLSEYEIIRLVAIVEFNASHNALTSVESNCFNKALSLQKVDFSYNEINMTIENIMFVNNHQLNYLNFYSNQITGLQENSFKQCSLSYINFENNNIKGDLKESIFTGLPKNLTKLDLSRQRIDAIRNNAFVHVHGLLYLNLSKNNIEIIETSSFVNISLTILDLSYNKISDINFLHNCFTNLTELYINNNNIAVIPKNGFENNQQLIKIDLSMNRIKTIEQYCLPIENLQYFNMRGNYLSGVIKKYMFSPAIDLKVLDLSNSNITRIENFAFVGLTALERLNFSNNQIEAIEPSNFNEVENIYSLDISHNRLSNLVLNNNNIITNLKFLYLNNNNLTSISSLILGKSKLFYIDISNNNIKNLLNVGAHLLPYLTVFNLANNKIETFNNLQVNTLTTLTELRLSSNKITKINLSYFKDLILVDLSNNKLSLLNITLLKNKEYLQSLDVSRNNITDLPPGTFQFMKNLKFLNVSSNYLTKLRFGCLKGLHKTELLDLSRNNIATLDVNVFHECDELKTLIIDYNRIKTFDVERLILITLKKLSTLSLGGNPMACTEIINNIKSTNDTVYTLKQVEVTSIDKIYHEDNVHGIKCGDDAVINESTTVQSDLVKSTGSQATTSSRIIMNYPCLPTTQQSSTTIIIVSVWCSILTILVITVGAVFYVKLYKKRGLVVSNNMTMQMRKSVELNGSDFQVDLLG